MKTVDWRLRCTAWHRTKSHVSADAGVEVGVQSCNPKKMVAASVGFFGNETVYSHIEVGFLANNCSNVRLGGGSSRTWLCRGGSSAAIRRILRL